jgi:hypothetical protein
MEVDFEVFNFYCSCEGYFIFMRIFYRILNWDQKRYPEPGKTEKTHPEKRDKYQYAAGNVG